MKKIFKQKKIMLYAGLILGVIYGLTARIFFDSSIATISFLVLVPLGLGVIPIFFTSKNTLNSYKWLLFIPWLSLILILGLLILFGVEDILCTIILFVPFFMIITLFAFLFILVDALIVKNKKNRNNTLVLIFLPFLFHPIEQSLDRPSENYTIKSSIIINASSDKIWGNIVAVDSIKNKEYNPGILNRLGIPRPINATVNNYGLGGIRTGNFEDGLIFTEKITKYDLNKEIAFSIKVDATSCKNKVFQKHVLNGDYFRFKNAVYKLTPMTNGNVKLSLISEYNLTSNINFYGRFWADIMIKDFQDRLLKVIKNRCEK